MVNSELKPKTINDFTKQNKSNHKKTELTMEDQVNNQFDKMAVDVKYAKNQEQEKRAVRRFNLYIRKKVSSEKLGDIKTQISERLKADDFIYGSEFIDLKAIRPYYDDMFKETEQKTSLPQKQKTGQKVNLNHNTAKIPEPKLYQSLVDGINKEELQNTHKGYSKNDLKKIIAYHNNLLNNTNENGTAFESIHENSDSDLKKFASGTLSIDKDSYAEMKEFIKIFGTNYKGELTPDGKAAYDRLNALIAESEKETSKNRILQYKKEKQEELNNSPEHISAILRTLDRVKDIAEKRQNTHKMNTQSSEFFIGTENRSNNEVKEKNIGTNLHPIPVLNNSTKKAEPQKTGIKKDTPTVAVASPAVAPLAVESPAVIPSVAAPSAVASQAMIPTMNKPEDNTKKEIAKNKKKRRLPKWLKIAGIIAVLAAAAALLKDCSKNKNQDDNNPKKPDSTIVIPPVVQDSIVLDSTDVSNGFYLERSEGFTAEQAKIAFNNAAETNKQDMLNVKKAIAKGNLDINSFVRNKDSKLKENVSIAEITYKMKILATNFPKSRIAPVIKDLFNGKTTPENNQGIYSSFSRVDDFGNVLNKDGSLMKTIKKTKNIDQDRRGPGSEKYGTQGTFDNFLQVAKNLRNNIK